MGTSDDVRGSKGWMRRIVRAGLGWACALVAAAALAGCAGAPAANEPAPAPAPAPQAAAPPVAPVAPAVAETELAPPTDTEMAAGVSPPGESEPPPAATFDPSAPPVLLARLAGAGDVELELELDPVSSCGPSVCGDGVPSSPGVYVRARRGAVVRVDVVDAEAGAGPRCSPYCVPGLLALWPLECVEGREARFGDVVLVAPFARRGGEIRLDAPAGSYLLSAFVYWNRADGTSGDVYATAGVRIARDGSVGVVPAADVGCRPPRVAKRSPLERAPDAADPGCADATAALDSLLPAATAVFVGTVTETGPANEAQGESAARLVRFAVTEPLRATVPSSVELAWPACAGAPSARTYLVLAGPSDSPDRPLALLDAYLVDTTTGEGTNAAGETVSVQAVIDRVAAEAE